LAIRKAKVKSEAEAGINGFKFYCHQGYEGEKR